MATLKSELVRSNEGREWAFRSLEPEDADCLMDFFEQVALDSTHTLQFVGKKSPSSEEMSKRLAFQKSEPSILNIGTFDGSKLVAYLNCRKPYPGHPWMDHIAQFGMMVLKEYWGQGIGRKLLDLQDGFAKANGIQRIEATVRVSNPRALRLYQNHGYLIEGCRKKVAFIEGQFQDEYFIAKLLNESPRPLTNEFVVPTLETARLILRPIRLEDAESIFRYAGNANVSRFTMWEQHKSIQDSLDFIKDYIFEYYKDGVPEPLGICLKEDPERVIGTVGCFWTSKQAKAMELAYALSEEFWGKGIGPEASKAVMDYCFDKFDLKRIQARCKTENVASARVMQKIGMSFEGTLKAEVFHRERYWDVHYYSKVRI